MTTKQKEHLESLKRKFNFRMSHKYVKGVKEHGGNLWEKNSLFLLDEAIDENIDQFVYLSTLREQLIRDGNRNNKHKA